MTNQPVPVAVIGVGGFGSWTLQAIRQCPSIRLVGLSDKDSSQASAAGDATGVPHFTDNRSMLAQTRPQIVYMCAPPMASPDLIGLCAERGIHVWKEMPLARNLTEAAAMVRRMDQAGLKFAVGTQRRFMPGYRRARELRDRLGAVFLARSHYLFNWGPNLSWRGDKSSSGGGALLELGYHFVDLMVWMLGLPDETYGLTAGGNRPEQASADGKPLPLYDTDDTAAAILRFGRGSMAVVATTRASGPVSEQLHLHGKGGSISATGETCLLRDPDGTTLDQINEDAPAMNVYVKQVEAFALAVACGSSRYECSARENLMSLAAIESIYLSDRTGQPETPARLLKTHGYSIDDCLMNSPSEDEPQVGAVQLDNPTG